MKLEKLEERIVEITPQQEEEILCNTDFVVAAVANYEKLVNTKPQKDEIGYIPEDGVRKRLVVKHPIGNIPTRRRRTAHYWKDNYNLFVPYWEYQHIKTSEKEIGRMLGCKIML